MNAQVLMVIWTVLINQGGSGNPVAISQTATQVSQATCLSAQNSLSKGFAVTNTISQHAIVVVKCVPLK